MRLGSLGMEGRKRRAGIGCMRPVLVVSLCIPHSRPIHRSFQQSHWPVVRLQLSLHAMHPRNTPHHTTTSHDVALLLHFALTRGKVRRAVALIIPVQSHPPNTEYCHNKPANPLLFLQLFSLNPLLQSPDCSRVALAQ